MYIETVRNRNSPPCILLRESHREGGKIRKRTLQNLTDWPANKVAALRDLLANREPGKVASDSDDPERTLPHGHVEACMAAARRLKLPELIDRTPSRQRDLVMALIISRLLDPKSKLATAAQLSPTEGTSTLNEELGLGEVNQDDLYYALDYLLARQPAIEQRLARRHLPEGTLVLYDVSSSFFEGHCCPLAQRGYSRDERRHNLQVVFGVLCAPDGRPVALEAFGGATSDPQTVGAQLVKLRDQFKLQHLVLIGDRGMLTSARLRADLRPLTGVEWVTALRAPAIQELRRSGALQMSLFDEQDLGEITDPENYPGERLIVCRNPLLAADRARTREELLLATEKALAKIASAVGRARRPLRGAAAIGLRVGKVRDAHRVGKHFQMTITDSSFTFARDQAAITEEAALDGIYVLRTNVPATVLDRDQTVLTYKRLAHVERAFRCLKTVDLRVRPIYHYAANRVRAHLFMCLLAYYLEWHLRRAWAPLLYADEADEATREALRPSVVAPAVRSPGARRKARTHKTADGLRLHSFSGLLANLGTRCRCYHRLAPTVAGETLISKVAKPTPVQARALALAAQV